MSAAPKLTEPKERPALFKAVMVRQILANLKWQTRRIMKPQPTPSIALGAATGDLWDWKDGTFTPRHPNTLLLKHCPYGVPGDRLWVRETWQPLWIDETAPDCTDLKEWRGAGVPPGWRINYPATDGVEEFWDESKEDSLSTRCVPSIHMPRWACRLTLELTDVRVERLNDISEEDAEAEGVERDATGEWRNYTDDTGVMPTARMSFMALWESINGAGSWDANPWVWALMFGRLP